MSDPLDNVRTVAMGMNRGSPHALALGIETVAVDETGTVMKVAYDPKLVGDPKTGVLAGGVVTALLDHCCGSAVHVAMKQVMVIATLDLRIDYMRAAEPGKAVYAKATCFKVTKNVAFVRAFAYEDSPDDPVAAAQAAFMLNSSNSTPMSILTPVQS